MFPIYFVRSFLRVRDDGIEWKKTSLENADMSDIYLILICLYVPTTGNSWCLRLPTSLLSRFLGFVVMQLFDAICGILSYVHCGNLAMAKALDRVSGSISHSEIWFMSEPGYLGYGPSALGAWSPRGRLPPWRAARGRRDGGNFPTALAEPKKSRC